MREIKFRAWDKEKKEWIYPYPEAFWIIGETTVFDMLKGYRIEDYNNIEILQFICHRDKNKVEIYEGDVVLDKWDEKSEVAWDDFNGSWVLRNKPSKTEDNFPNRKDGFIYHGYQFNKAHKDLEIIGNIKENPELLKR